MSEASHRYTLPTKAGIKRMMRVENERKCSFWERCLKFTNGLGHRNEFGRLVKGQDTQTHRFVSRTLFEFKQSIQGI